MPQNGTVIRPIQLSECMSHSGLCHMHARVHVFMQKTLGKRQCGVLVQKIGFASLERPPETVRSV